MYRFQIHVEDRAGMHLVSFKEKPFLIPWKEGWHQGHHPAILDTLITAG